MLRAFAALVSLAMIAFGSHAYAHMVLIVPQPDGTTVFVILSDNLEPDPKVKMTKVEPIQLNAYVNGQAQPLKTELAEAKLVASIPSQTKLIAGTVTYGALKKGDASFLLAYHPKAVLAGASTTEATIGAKAALEIVPVTQNGKTRFQLLASGKAVANAEGTVTLPDGTKESVETDAEGFTQSFEATGRYSAYFKHTEKKSGEQDGIKYEEVRHYATIVADVK